MAERGDLVTVKATIKSKAEIAEKLGSFKVELDIPSFGSKYPIPVTVTAEQAAKLPLGQTGVLVLVRENQKAKATDLSKDFNWYWGFKRVATTADAPPEEAKAQPQAPKGASQGQGNEREDRTDRRTALMQAVAYHAAFAHLYQEQPMRPKATEVLETASWFAKWLRELEEAAQAKAQEVPGAAKD